MISKVKFLTLTISLIGCFLISDAQNDSLKQKIIDSINNDLESILKNRKLVGIPIAKVVFDSMVDNYYRRITNEKFAFSDNEYVNIVRIYNTICLFSDNEITLHYKAYKNEIQAKVLNEAFVKLEAHFGNGGSVYSKKYDIYIGGYGNQNSLYVFKE